MKALITVIILITISLQNLMVHCRPHENHSASRRGRRHAVKHGNCKPIVTDLGHGLAILHDTPVREESFYVKPRSTFDKIMLQMRLDNTLSQSEPDIYDLRVEFTADDLHAINYTAGTWIEVKAKFYIVRTVLNNIYKLRLNVGNWVKEAELTRSKILFFYSFDSLVFWGKGGAEWTFDCLPNNVIEETDELTFDTPITDERWWFIAAAIVILIFTLMLCCCCIIGIYKCCRSSDHIPSYITNAMTFKSARSPSALEPIYDELSATSLQKLQRRFANMGIEGFNSSPAPPSCVPPSSAAASTVLTPPSPLQEPLTLCEVQDSDWFSTLEHQHATPKCGASPSEPGQCSSSTVPRTQRQENPYSNEPKLKKQESSPYVDMSRYKVPRGSSRR